MNESTQQNATSKTNIANVEIRDAILQDVEVILHITGEAFGPMSTGRMMEEFFGAPLGGISWKEYKCQEVAREAQDSMHHFIIAKVDDAVVGYASWSYDATRDLATIGHNAVLPEYQGRGIGSALQKEIVKQLDAAGHTRWKVTTLAHDYPAQRVYEKMGFEEIARSVVYLRKG